MHHQNEFLDLVNEYRPQVKETDVSHVKSRLDNNDKFVLIDVREDNEWDKGHIPTAIHLSRGIIERDIVKVIPNKSSEIILYCGGGFRSVLSAYNLQKMGYANVISMDGGISGWTSSGHKLVIS